MNFFLYGNGEFSIRKCHNIKSFLYGWRYISEKKEGAILYTEMAYIVASTEGIGIFTFKFHYISSKIQIGIGVSMGICV